MLAPVAIEQRLVGLVSDELPLGWVPLQLPAVPVGKVAQDNDGNRSGPDLDVGNRAFSRADAVEPVAVMSGRLVKVNVAASNGSLMIESGSLVRTPRSMWSVPAVPVKTHPLGPPCVITTPLL